MRVAAIDIGSNSIRCTIVEVPVGGPRKTLDDEKAYTRLGRGLSETGRMDGRAIDESIEALGRMLQIARQHEATHIRAVATAAVRTATNADEFLARAREELGLEVEVISEEEEGRLAFLSAADSVRLEGRSAVVDIGGGSLEIVKAVDRQIEFIASMPLGAVVLSERYHREDPMPADDYDLLVKHVRRTIKHSLDNKTDPVGTLVGSGGAITTAAALIAAESDPGLLSLQSYVLRRADIVHLLAYLKRSSAAERTAMRGMPENRVDIIVAGIVVLSEAMRALGANEIVVNTRGIREGIVIDIIERERGIAVPFDRLQSVREFGHRCHADTAHAEQVRSLALQLFDALQAPFDLDPGTRPLLEAAALLHDVGYLIAYERHHRHSYHLISYAELPGFSPAEIRIIAACARYHRGTLPHAGHEALRGLDQRERQIVLSLGALLRFTDGLDRSRGQRVTSLRVTTTPGRLTVLVAGTPPLNVEIHGARRKTDLIERTFGVVVDVDEARDEVASGCTR